MDKVSILLDHPGLKKQAEEQYAYQLALTAELDALSTADFTTETLLKIVLWKLNRYPEMGGSLLEAINDLRQDGSEQRARLLLDKLLSTKGIDLPLASTFLRFACPQQFQIIDQRVYRFISPDVDVLKLPRKKADKIEFYFNYLKRLRETCLTHEIDFRHADRMLYQLDKIRNKGLPIKY